MIDPSVHESHPQITDGALQAVQRICEDSAIKLALDDAHRPLDSLIPRLLALMACADVGVRLKALSSYNALLYLLGPQSVPTEGSSWSRASSQTDGFEDSNRGPAGRGPSPQGAAFC